MSHSLVTQTQFLTLRAQGLSYDAIARQLHVSKHTLLKWAKALQPQLDAIQAAALETALEKYQVVLLQRVEFFAQQFQRIQKTITHCDLWSSWVPRIFNLLLKLHTTLEQFDPNPANIHLDSTETAPPINSDPVSVNQCESVSENSPPLSTDSAPEIIPPADTSESTISAPVSSSSRTEHQALSTEHFLPNPQLSPESTKTAPILNPKSEVLNPEPESTESAPVINVEPETLNSEQNPCPSCNSCQKNPAELVEAKLLEFTTHYRRQHHTEPPESELQKLHQILKRLDRMETKIAS